MFYYFCRSGCSMYPHSCPQPRLPIRSPKAPGIILGGQSGPRHEERAHTKREREVGEAVTVECAIGLGEAQPEAVEIGNVALVRKKWEGAEETYEENTCTTDVSQGKLSDSDKLKKGNVVPVRTAIAACSTERSSCEKISVWIIN